MSAWATESVEAAIRDAVRVERRRQDELWGEVHPDKVGRDPGTWLAILMEEVGEASKETIEDGSGLVTELVQVAAVCEAWLLALMCGGPTTVAK